MESSLYKLFPDLSKIEPLDGSSYKRWAWRLLIFFEQLEIDYVLNENCPEHPAESDTNIVQVDEDLEEKIKKYKKTNKLVEVIFWAIWQIRCLISLSIINLLNLFGHSIEEVRNWWCGQKKMLLGSGYNLRWLITSWIWIKVMSMNIWCLRGVWVWKCAMCYELMF